MSIINNFYTTAWAIFVVPEIIKYLKESLNIQKILAMECVINKLLCHQKIYLENGVVGTFWNDFKEFHQKLPLFDIKYCWSSPNIPDVNSHL